MKKPIFSVIVPIYNVSDYLDNCIQSVLDQSFTDFELILVEDGSTDGCYEICESYKHDPHVKIIHKQNEGLVRARQSGAEIAKGDYIVCLDGDDWLEKNYLESMHQVIAEYSPDVVCCGRKDSDGVNNVSLPFPLQEGFYDREAMENIILPYIIEDEKGRYFPPSVWAKCFKRSIYTKYQKLVDGKIKIGEDMACTRPTIAHSNSLYLLKAPLYYYRQNPASMTKEKKAFSWDGPKLIGQHLEKTMDMESFDFKEQNYRFITHNIFIVALSQFNRNEPISVIRQDILDHISDEYYVDAVNKAKFNFFSKGYAARLCLKYHLVKVMRILSKLSNP